MVAEGHPQCLEPMSELHWIDSSILFAYAAATLAIGFWISKRASKNINSYFLGGNTIPWYMLGLSNASGMFDISGTMLMVYWLFIYGLKSVWIPWLWPVFNQVFMMVFLSVWLRRSGVMTGAEWIRFRFGDGRGAQLAHLIVVRVRVGECGRLPCLRFHRHRQVRGDLPSLGAIRRPGHQCQPLRPDHHGSHDALRGEGWHVQRCVHRGAAVLHHDGRLRVGRRDRHAEGVAGDARHGHPRRMEGYLLRAQARARLVGAHGRRQREDRLRRLGAVRVLRRPDAAKGHPPEHRRAPRRTTTCSGCSPPAPRAKPPS